VEQLLSGPEWPRSFASSGVARFSRVDPKLPSGFRRASGRIAARLLQIHGGTAQKSADSNG
jgi:hypothetical protein